jgi:hypothetical protein
MGRCSAIGHEVLSTQVLQSVHLQLPFIRGKLPESSRIQWLCGVECFECGGPCLVSWPMGRQNVCCSVILTFLNCDMHRYFNGWLVFPSRDGGILCSFDWMVCFHSILH